MIMEQQTQMKTCKCYDWALPLFQEVLLDLQIHSLMDGLMAGMASQNQTPPQE